MPELPEVEVVRRGAAQWLVGRRISAVQVFAPRVIHAGVTRVAGGPGPQAVETFRERLSGATILDSCRRGKFLWFPLQTGEHHDTSLMMHLGMSGQVLVREDAEPVRHERVRLSFADGGPDVVYADQRMFGYLRIADHHASEVVPVAMRHIAPDPLEAHFDAGECCSRIRASGRGIKRVILDQSVVSGIGNIYADEALWRAKLHYSRVASSLPVRRVRELLAHAGDVMRESLQAGGTSFDSLYVNVNGESGYFSRGLNVYGREGQPCNRCANPISREPFDGRSSYVCRRCQRRRSPS